MSVFFSPIGNDAPFLDASGNPLNAGLLYTYEAGSSTPATTYTTSAGSVANANPIVLNSNGYPASGGSVVSIWLTATQAYKFTLKTSAGVEVWSRDGISGINDQSVAQDEWVAGPAPTYISATSFSLAGDQTTAFHEGRRLKLTDGGGTKYVTITTSAYTTLTTVTVAGDTLSTPTTAVSYSLISASNPSISAEMVNRKGNSVASAATCDIWNTQGDYLHITGSTGPITSFGTAPYAGAKKELVFDSTPTITYNGTTMLLPGGIDLVMAANDRIIVRADTTANMVVMSVFRASTGAYININGATEDTTPDLGADYVLTYDASATGPKKVLLGRAGAGVIGSEVVSTSGAAVEINTTIPAWAKEIVLTFEGVSSSGTSPWMIQIGDGAYESSGYACRAAAVVANASGGGTNGFHLQDAAVAANVAEGQVRLVLKDAANFTWSMTGILCYIGGEVFLSAGTKSLSSALDRVQITTNGGTDTFDAGSIGIVYR